MEASNTATDDTTERLLDIIAKEGMIDRDSLTLDSKLEDFSIASADFVMILMAIEEQFEVYVSMDDELSNAKTLRDLVNTFHTRIEENQSRVS